jgi:hypothetical protein
VSYRAGANKIAQVIPWNHTEGTLSMTLSTHIIGRPPGGQAVKYTFLPSPREVGAGLTKTQSFYGSVPAGVVHISSYPILLNKATSAGTRVSGLSSQVWTLMEALSGSTAMCHSDKLLLKHLASK